MVRRLHRHLKKFVLFTDERLPGDLIYLENLGKPMLIINSYEIAVELLERRSAIYSSRPHIVMLQDLYVIAFRSQARAHLMQ